MKCSGKSILLGLIKHGIQDRFRFCWIRGSMPTKEAVYKLLWVFFFIEINLMGKVPMVVISQIGRHSLEGS